MKNRVIRLMCALAVLLLVFTGCSSEPDYYYGSSAGGSSRKSSVPAMAGTQTDNKSDPNAKRVALTFDDGPHNVRTKAIVDELNKYGYHATFFVIGNRVDGTAYKGGEALIYAASSGNEIGIHGYTHEVYYDTCSDSVYSNELSKTETAIKSKVSGQAVKLMRPTGGRITDERVKSNKYSVIMWSVDSEDWKYKYSSSDSYTDAEKKQRVHTIVTNIMSEVENGSIILMHDIYESTYDSVVILLQRLHEEGYEVVTVSELLGSNITAGKKYSKA